MKRPNRYGGFHAQAPQPTRITAIIIISFFIAAVLIGLILLICYSGKLSGGKVSHPQVAAPSPAFPLGGATGHPSRGNPVNRLSAHSSTTLPLDEPLLPRVPKIAKGGGQSDSGQASQDGSAAPRERPAIEVMQQAVVEAQAARVRADLVARLTAHMQQTNTVQGLVDLAPLMVDLGQQTGNDPRLCPVTATEESSGGRVLHGDYNPFGIGGQARKVDFASWEAVVRYYFAQITGYGYNGDVWRIAFKWYDLSDPGGRSTRYANNILRAVQSF